MTVLAALVAPVCERCPTVCDPLRGRGQAARGRLVVGARGRALTDGSGGRLSVSTIYDECLGVGGIAGCRCVKLALITPFVHFSCFCLVPLWWKNSG